MYKKLTFSFFLAANLFSIALIAQRFEAGMVLGFNMSQVDGDDLGGVWNGFNRIGIVAGPRVDTRLNDQWSIGLELLFSQLGSAKSRYDLLSRYDNIRFNFVEVPVMLNFRDWLIDDSDGDYYRLEFTAGVSYGRLINYTATGFSGEDLTELEDYTDNALFINFGATYYFNQNWALHAHWSKSLTDLNNRPPDIGDDNIFLSRHINVKAIYFF